MGSAWECGPCPTRVERGVNKPQSSRCLTPSVCVSREDNIGAVAVFYRALHAATGIRVNLGTRSSMGASERSPARS